MEHTKDLCDGCGLCCNSILWPGVHVDESKTHLFNTITPDKGFNHNGESIILNSGMHLFKKKCEHLDSCNLCGIYDDRPTNCRNFYCGVFREVEDNKITFEFAQSLIKELKSNPNNQSLVSRFKIFPQKINKL